MNSSFLNILQGPEFWMSFAFVCVVFFSARPLKRFLSAWGKERAAKIQMQIDETVSLKKQADDLLKKYEMHVRNQSHEEAALLKEAEKESNILRKQAEEALREKLKKKDEAVELRLKAAYENAERTTRRWLLNETLEKTKQIISQTPSDQADTDAALEMIYAALDKASFLAQSKTQSKPSFLKE